MTQDPFVQLIAVSKAYGSVFALTDINLEIRAGEIVCLLGDNGAGKSSLVRLISGVELPTSGRLLVRGAEVGRWNPSRARQLGIETVYQDKALAVNQDVTDNIFMGREITGWFGFVKKRTQRAEAERIMRSIGFTSRVMSPDSTVNMLSGGEREGVAIARAMYFKAELVILDEPTTALSLTQSQEVLQFIRRLKDQGAGVLFISHNIFHAHEVGDRLVLLDRGSIAAEFQRGQMSAEDLVRYMQETARFGRRSA